MPQLLSDTALVFGRYFRQVLGSWMALMFGLMMPLLYLVFFGPLLHTVPLGGGASSWQLLVPGLMVQLGLFSAAFAGFEILIEKQHGVVERMRVTPVSRLALLLGRVLKDAVQLSVQSLILVLAGLALGLRAPVLGILIGFVFVGVLAVSIASLSYALAKRVSSPQAFAPAINAVNMPAMLLSGLLLPMALAPGWLDTLSHFVPFRYVVDAIRAAFTGNYGGTTMLYGGLMSAGLALIAVTVGTRVFTRAGA